MSCGLLVALLAASLAVRPAEAGQWRVLDAQMHHLRSGDEREWSEFPEQAEKDRLELTFTAKVNEAPATLRLRHIDLKYGWNLYVNDALIGRLPRDEYDSVTLCEVPGGTLVDGENRLRVEATNQRTDDVLVGDVRLHERPPAEVLQQAWLDAEVVDERGDPLPCRLTLVNEHGTLVPIGAESDEHLAVRPGNIYTGDGKARVGLLPGRYRLFATRGMEYSLARTEFEVQPGETVRRRMQIRRELTTPGYVSCDTHVHTLTFSGHGDAMIKERILSIAGEGLELPVATEHNLHRDYDAYARQQGLRQYFTPVVGNEVTTPVGHFNIFPVDVQSPPPEHRADQWLPTFESIRRTPGVEVVILNHARDLHSGFRPFGPKHHNSLLGKNLHGWPIQIDGMEIINSGALQTDMMQLYHDWFGLLNRGLQVAPIGSSDSHDVARKLVAQGRTYIQCPDGDPANIDVALACRRLREGRVVLSMGLFPEVTVDQRHGPGDLVPVEGEVEVAVRVLGPSWITADRVALYANGVKIREQAIAASSADATTATGSPVVKWQGSWTLPKPPHDVNLVVIATGPGDTGPYWPIPKTYQPTSIVWQPYVVGSTGAIWLDEDGDKRPTAARQYAETLVERTAADLPALVSALSDYDEVVAAHAIDLVVGSLEVSPLDETISEAFGRGSESTRAGYRRYLDAWRQNLQAAP